MSSSRSLSRPLFRANRLPPEAPNPAIAVRVREESPDDAEDNVVFSKQPTVQTDPGVEGVDIVCSIQVGTGTLAGTTTVATDSNGLATFTDLKITGTGVPITSQGRHVLRFRATGYQTFVDWEVDVEVGTWVLTTPPAGAVDNVDFATQPVLTSSNLQDSWAMFASIVEGTGTLSGAGPIGVTSGVATFTNLKIVGTGPHTLSFNSDNALPAVVAIEVGTVTGTPFTYPSLPVGPAIITKSVKASGGDYATMAAAIAALPASLVTADETWVFELYDEVYAESSLRITQAASATDATRFIVIKPAAGEGHAGLADGTGPRFYPTSMTEGERIFDFDDCKVEVWPGLVVGNVNETHSAGVSYCFALAGAHGSKVLGTITHDFDVSKSNRGINVFECDNVDVIGNLVYQILEHNSGNARGIKVEYNTAAGTGNRCYHNTVDGVTTTGIQIIAGAGATAGKTILVKNNIATGSGGDDFSFSDSSGNSLILNDYNISEDTTAAGTNSTISVTRTSQFVLLTGGSENYHMKSGADSINGGVDVALTMGDHDTPPDSYFDDVGYDSGLGTAAPISLAVTTQPAGGDDGVAFTTQPVITASDAGASKTVTAVLVAGSGTLGGTLTAVTNGSGVATFTNLKITGSGSHTLSFSATSYVAAAATIFVTGAGTGGVVINSLDFNDGTNLITLGVTKAGSTSGNLPYRKHSFTATGGVGGTGAIRMDWFTDMSIGFSPLWIREPFALWHKIEFDFLMSTPMQHPGSSVKVYRSGNVGHARRWGMLESSNDPSSNPTSQRLQWHWEHIGTGGRKNMNGWYGPVVGTPPATYVDNLADGNYHHLSMEWDMRNSAAIVAQIIVDGTIISRPDAANNPGWMGPVSADAQNFTLLAPGDAMDTSPFCEMYSCGQGANQPGGCQESINTGHYIVDNYVYTDMSL